jgi:ribose-phosphate pyrophosphokinase
LDKHDTSESFQIIGDVGGKTALIVDDVISTGGTIAHSAESLRAAGAAHVIVLATHGVFAGDAVTHLAKAPIDEILVTNTIAQTKDKYLDKVHCISVAPILSDAILRIVR